jgi:signal transduction histidine kinase/DNA-binding NarL/FixJ family response regulator
MKARLPGSFRATVATFAAAGLVLTVAAVAVLFNLKARAIERTLAEIGNRTVEAVGGTFAISIWPRVGLLLRAGGSQNYAFADAVIAAFARDAHVLKLKLFDGEGTAFYSPVQREIGARTVNPEAFAQALQRGKGAINSHRNRQVETANGPVTVDSVVSVYVPVRDLGGNLEAVAEIYIDTSEARSRLEAEMRWLDPTIAAILGTLYAAMLAVVWRTARTNARHEAALEIERGRLADFTEIATGWVWETDARLRLTHLSEGVRAVGVDPADEIGTLASAWHQPTGPNRDGPSLADMMLARREFRDVVIRFRTPDDRRLVWIARSGKPVFDSAGAFQGYRGTDREKTAVVEGARQLQLANAAQTGLLDELEKTRERLELALRTAAMGWWEREITTGRQYWSPRALEIWGFAPDIEPDYPMILAAIHPEDRAKTVNILEAPGNTARRSHRVLLPDGSIRFIREDFRIDRRADGSVARLFATVIDLTDVEALRTAAEKGKATLDSALDAMAEGFALYDADDRLLASNRRFRELLGWEPALGTDFATIARRNLAATHPDAGPATIDELVAERMRRHREAAGAFEIATGDGGRHEVKESRAENGFTVTTYSDITQARRDAEELAVAKSAAEQANLVKSRFLATMSHEIRTPMNGVLGMIELLVDTPLDTRQRGYVDIANRSAHGLLSIIDDILDYSRLESGDLKVENVAYGPAEIARQTIELLAVSAQKKGLGVAIDIDPTVPERIGGDPTRFRQILLNLLGNAIKFTAHGSVGVRMSVVPAPAGGELLRLAVSDTGIGIAPEKMAGLFDHFRQADDTISRRFGGSGLGLAISRELARLMGGDLDATSVPGEGSVFELRIPVLPAPTVPVPAGERFDAGPGLRVRSLDILVAEDNEINRIVVGEMLDRMGHHYTFAHDGAAAIAAARAKVYDVILMDSQMPDVDGIEATRWIRVLPGANGRVPIVAQTANAMRGDREKFLAAGMVDYIAKPLEVAELAEVLARVTGAASRPVAPNAVARAPSPGSATARRGLAALAAAQRNASTET